MSDERTETTGREASFASIEQAIRELVTHPLPNTAFEREVAAIMADVAARAAEATPTTQGEGGTGFMASGDAYRRGVEDALERFTGMDAGERQASYALLAATPTTENQSPAPPATLDEALACDARRMALICADCDMPLGHHIARVSGVHCPSGGMWVEPRDPSPVSADATPANYPATLRRLGARLADLLDADHWNEIEPMLHELAAGGGNENLSGGRDAMRDAAMLFSWDDARYLDDSIFWNLPADDALRGFVRLLGERIRKLVRAYVGEPFPQTQKSESISGPRVGLDVHDTPGGNHLVVEHFAASRETAGPTDAEIRKVKEALRAEGIGVASYILRPILTRLLASRSGETGGRALEKDQEGAAQASTSLETPALRVYGNHLPPDAPAGLQVTLHPELRAAYAAIDRGVVRINELVDAAEDAKRSLLSGDFTRDPYGQAEDIAMMLDRALRGLGNAGEVSRPARPITPSAAASPKLKNANDLGTA